MNTKNFRAPAVPLITHDPFFSVWSFADQLTDDVPRHWDGVRKYMIGLLAVDGSTGKHRYEPQSRAVKELAGKAGLTREMREGTGGFVVPIPFFLNRLTNMKRWGLDEINYQTDWFLIRRIPGE